MNPLALVGKVLDRRYRITEFLGRGSFGWTYAAEELLREEPVSTCALKLLWPRSDEERVSAVAAVAAHARRSHPRLLAYRATGEATTPRSLKDTLYVVLELGQQSLAARIEQPERMKASEVLALAVHVCEALAHLEALDTRHRDVKPANLLWVGEGWKLGDFGLVRTLDGSVVKSLGPSATPRYLAPEVLQGKASIASDIWALAVIVQECLTGTLPFSGATEFELLTGIASAEPDIATALPPRLETFVRRSLVREGRWRAAEALAFLTAADVPARLEREVEKDDTDGSSRFFSDVPTRSRTRAAAASMAKPPVAPAAPEPLAAPAMPVAPHLSAVPAAVAAGGGGLRVLGQNVQGFEEVENVKDGTRLIRIPAGSFFMGSEAQDYEKPVHSQALPSFWMAKTPVTNAQYRRFVAETGRITAGQWEIAANAWGERCPVVGVSWHDAVAYAAWAGLRLPTEAEWEYAARGAGAWVYPWGGVWDPTRCCNGVGVDDACAMPVDGHGAGASPFGCLAMAGNVWEWCSSLFRRYPFDPTDGRQRVETRKGDGRALRGGGWTDDDPDRFRCAARSWLSPELCDDDTGFRCALTI